MTKEAFEEQIIGMQSALYYVSYCLLTNRADQDDAVQECIKKALVKRESLREEKYLKTWITRILINECHNVLRRRSKEVLVDEFYASAPSTADQGLFEHVSNLEEKLRLPIVLHYMEGYTTREIAKILRVPEGTIKSRLVKARRILGETIKAEEVYS